MAPGSTVEDSHRDPNKAPCIGRRIIRTSGPPLRHRGNWTGPRRLNAHDLRSLTNHGVSTLISYRYLSSPARSVGARFCSLTAIQACIEGGSGGPGKLIEWLFASF
ncbi:hypothetical protein CROQUDRAFT_96522 [Cronartium quercuum f. sp. fusiforme G11]|uniref:Uncharacterized protein n=1 Tax=Cronartium quercuum f. sp. fusiforme G11 TaxID=708437 RepID=A0A9P6T967_9BASI|nr:hypothetical protein CROQUDRAFT_96522 [Cronartium quercuum f. sp. fusiforme G11]